MVKCAQISVLLMVLFCVGYSAGGAETGSAAPKSAEPVKIGAADVAVTVNGVAVDESQVEAGVKAEFERMSKRYGGKQLPPAFMDQYKKMIRQQVLDQLIVEQLLEEEVKKTKTVVTEEDVTGELKKLAAMEKPPLSLEDFTALVEAYGESIDGLKQQIRKGLGYERLFEEQFAGRLKFTDDDAKKHYSENQKRFNKPAQVRASHILIAFANVDPNATDPDAAKAKAKTDAKAKAEDLLKQIKAGTDFAKLAKEHSDDKRSAVVGGDLRFFPKNQMIPAFDKVAFGLQIGQVSDLVETKYGYHIIKATDRKEAATTFEQAKEEVMAELTQNKKRELGSGYIEKLKAAAKITYPPGKEPKKPDKPPVSIVKPSSDLKKAAETKDKPANK